MKNDDALACTHRRKLVWPAMTFFFVLTAAAGELRDVEFARPDGIALTLDGWIPETTRSQAAVVLVHGGGWEAGDKRTYIGPWFETLAQAGIAWITINYRLSGQAKHPAAVEDIEAAVRWVRVNAKRLRIDASRIALMGESAGAHLAMLAALRGRERVATVVGFYGVYDVPLWVQQRGELPRNIGRYLPDSDPATLRATSPVEYVHAKAPPLLLIHGSADKGVPSAQSERLCQAARAKGVRCELMVIEGAPHGVENWERNDRFQAWKPRVTTWLADTLRVTHASPRRRRISQGSIAPGSSRMSYSSSRNWLSRTTRSIAVPSDGSPDS
ncbi:MAG TPA: alpha/beta hydrolase [Bryobacteraceae bacterium]|nr:alpha/beta hydrolase [Bryobacteraceae bacterium]